MSVCSVGIGADDRFTDTTESGVLFARNAMIDILHESLGPLASGPGVVFRRHGTTPDLVAASFSSLGFACLVRGDGMQQGDETIAALLGNVVTVFGLLGKQEGDCFIAVVDSPGAALTMVIHDVRATTSVAWVVRNFADPTSTAIISVECVAPFPRGTNSWEAWSSTAFRALLSDPAGVSTVHSVSLEGVAFTRPDSSVEILLNRTSGAINLAVCIPESPASKVGEGYSKYEKLGATEIARLMFAGQRAGGEIDPLAYFACLKEG